MNLSSIGHNLRSARKQKYPNDDLRAFALRIGVSRATLQKMEKGDLTVSLSKYVEAAKILECEDAFNHLFEIESSMFDD